MPVSNSPQAIQPLTGREKFGNHAVMIQELPFVYKLLLRGDGSDSFTHMVKKAIGTAPPTDMRTSVSCKAGVMFRTTPDEWLLRIATAKSFTQIQNDLQKALSTQHAACIDVSDYYTVIRIEGKSAVELLQKNSCFDFSRLSKNDAVTTRYASCTIHCHCVGSTVIDIQLRWTHAPYVWDMLTNSAKYSANH